MESVIFPVQEVLPLIYQLPALFSTHKEMGRNLTSVPSVIFVMGIICFYYMFKRAGTNDLKYTKLGDKRTCDQKETYKNNIEEATISPKMEWEYNCYFLLESKSREAQEDEEEYNCKEKGQFHDLNIRYIAKRAYCERKAQCDDVTKDVKKNLTKGSTDELHIQYEQPINTLLRSRLKLRDSEFQVSFSRVVCHQPLKINGIPWSQMKEEWWRLHTFSLYPRKASCSSILLARHGFLYVGNGMSDDDTVICAFCLSAAKDLGSDTDIEKLHYSLNSNCPIVKGFDCQNVRIKECDGNRISYILSLLNHVNKSYNTSLSGSGQQYEIQPLPLESDCPGASMTRSVTSQRNNNAGFNASCHQVTENNATSVVVTNFAQSLSLPVSDVTHAEGTRRDYEAQQLPAPPAARPDSVPSAKPSSGSSGRRSQTTNSESSRGHTRSNNSQSNSSNSSSHTSRQEEARSSTSSSQEHPENSTSSPPQTVSENQDAPSSNSNSYDRLGIITARPKRPEYAVEITRLHSFEGWPQDHHIKAVDLAQAGYFYTGYSDCARCFCCGGGLRNWEVGDDVWVEHARWFPKCAFIRQMMGQPFIDVVQDLNKEKEIIPYDDVIKEMKVNGLEHAIPKEIKDKSIELERDAAVTTISDNGFMMEDILKAAEELRDAGQSLSADAIYEELEKKKVTKQSASIKTDDDSQSISKKGNEKKDQEMFETLRGENSQLRQQSQCKICMDKEVSVVFLPCGHFISCNDCSFALRNCPVCRDSIKGVVRAYLK